MKRTRCLMCQRELTPRRRSDMRFCGGACRVRAHRLRRLDASSPQEAHQGSALPVGLVGVAAAALVIETLAETITPSTAQHAQDLAALEQERQTSAALRTQLAEQRAQFDAEIKQKRAEWAAAEEERLRAALRAERVDANNGLGMAYAQIRDLRYERAKAVDEKRLAEENLKKLQAEHAEQHCQLDHAKVEIKLLTDGSQENADLQRQHHQEIAGLRGTLNETTERCRRLLQAKNDLGELLDAEIKYGDHVSDENEILRLQLQQQAEQAKRLAEQERRTRTHLAGADEAYAALRVRYASLAEQHRGLLAANGKSYEALRLDYNELVSKHNRLLRTGRERHQALVLQYENLAGEYQAALSGYNALVGQYNGRMAEYNALVDKYNWLLTTDQAAYAALHLSYCTLTEQYNRLLAAPAYHQASWADERQQLAAENARLRFENYTLAERLTEASEVTSSLQGAVINQRRQLERAKMEQALLASGEQHKPGRRGGRHELRSKGDEAPRLKAPEGSGSVWATMAPLMKGAAAGAAGLLAVGAFIASGRSDQARLTAGQEERKRLEGDVG